MPVAVRAATVRERVSVGDVADLVLLGDDPAVLAAGGAGALRQMQVLGTMLAGEWTHRRGL